MNWLKDDLGFYGWRFDFSKGYAAKFTAEYIKATGLDQAFNVGEYWTDLHWEGDRLGHNQDHAR